MLAETVAHTDGQTLRILKYRRATIALRAIVARQSARQFTQRYTHNQNVCIVTMRAGDG